MSDGVHSSPLGEASAWFDRLPPALDEAVLAATVGDLASRLHGVVRWREALLAGEVPEASLPWPPDDLSPPLALAVTASGLLPFTRGHPELTDALLEQLVRFVEEERSDRPAGDRAAEWHARLEAVWGERRRLWTQLVSLLRPLGGGLGLFDLSKGLLHVAGGREVARLHELLRHLPEWAELLRLVGRPDEGFGPLFAPILAPLRGSNREGQLPVVPTERSGLERLGDPARMLPSEALLLRRPVLRRLWHARRAEGALVGYRTDGRTFVTGPLKATGAQAPTLRRRGPLAVVVDVSGSMSGAPERVAKALALEAARLAHADRRPCRLFAFGGPDQVVERSLSFDAGGLDALLDFLTLRFGGGTAPGAALRRVGELLSEPEFARADLLLLTDGLFELEAGEVEAMRTTLAQAEARCHGVMVGAEPSAAALALCDEVHRFEAWDRLSG